MRAAWVTDPHFDHLDDAAFARFAEGVRALAPEALLLTGDLCDARSVEGTLRRVREAVAAPVLFVLGNHDYYGGSVDGVRAWAASAHGRDPDLRWLPAAGPWRASDGTVVVGVDGWCDGRAGDPDGSTVLLNDWRMIRDFADVGAMFDVAARKAVMQRLADADAAALTATLDAVCPTAARVVVLTHVPPFVGACWHQGAISNAQWLPWFTCVAVGEALTRAADRWPEVTLDVYCGHTHSAGEHRPRRNLAVFTGPGRYGDAFVTPLR
ncbi:MAG: metallophosphoesterase [Polyangiales bacterium]